MDSDDAVRHPNETIQTNFYRHVRLTSRDNNKLLEWSLELSAGPRAGSSQFTLNEYTLYFPPQKKK